MENNYVASQFTEHELKVYTPLLRQFGKVFGFMICTVKCDNIDLRYKEKRNANNIANLTTNLPVKKYYVESFLVTSAILDKMANGNPVIIFNGRDDLRFPLSQDSCNNILRTTKKEINKAIIEFEESRGEKIKFFTDVELCTEVAMELNTSNSEALYRLAEDLMNQANSIQTVNNTIKENLDSYLSTMSDSE